MTLLEKIKADLLEARKAKDSAKSAALNTLFAEAESVGKNKGNRDSTDEEVIATVKKFIENVDTCLTNFGEYTLFDVNSDNYKKRVEMLEFEKKVYLQYLPKQLSAQDLEGIILETFPEKVHIGIIMKHLVSNFPGQYDGKVAKSVIENLY